MRPLTPLALLAALAAAGPAAGPPRKADPPPAPEARAGLRVEGEVTVVVTKLPFRVVAPAGAKLYFWQIPPGWEADAPPAGNVCTVTKAGGSADVTVKAVMPDFTVRELAATVRLALPPPPAPDPLLAALRAAYAAEADPAKAKLGAGLAAVYRAAAELSADEKLAPTWGALHARMRAGAQAAGVAGRLAAVQAAVGADLAARLPVNPAAAPQTPVAAEHRKLLAAQFSRVAALLEEVCK